MNREKLESLCIDDGGCLIWQRSCCNGHPAIGYDGKTQLVRRVLWSQEVGAIPIGKILRTTCGNPKCIEKSHTELTAYQKLGKELGAIGVMSGPVRSAAIARTKRNGQQAKLTVEAVKDIRSSDERGRVLAARWGVSEGHISKIQKHKAFRDFTSPFAGLGARA